MRIALGFGALCCLGILGFGIHLVLEEQRQVTSFSATTTAIVSEKHVKVETFRDCDDYLQSSFEPVVTFQYEVHGQRFTGNRVFRSPFVIAGNLGAAFVQATVDRFEIGQEVPVYYQPDNPTEACLIRRPSLYVYLVILGAVISLGLVVSVWPLRRAGRVPNHRRKGRWIAALWYLAGLACGVHYFYLAGTDYTAWASWLFGIYLYVGLIPVAAALPSEGGAERVKLAIELSFLGAFFGLWPGAGAACLVDLFWHQGQIIPHLWAAYTAAVAAPLFALLGLFGMVTRGTGTTIGKKNMTR